ncbi:hypothetical protein GCM10017044_15250 [Kordiimonas sediminis]|uniref:Uncharacterized protein n=1 Tax=Kordiimonas sediminis TaxID=1735581 RepID=A0A919E7H5_9PROT|nr:hypothetical protein [Kordiimonas sediminis]GHF22099.1 hypothetical protein GCM10017044_15250 [Kordiimonas sediminis]
MDPWFKNVCNSLEAQHGYGWKNKLANIVGVSPSNVQSWIKAGKVPPAVATAIKQHEDIERLTSELAHYRNVSSHVNFNQSSDLPYEILERKEEFLVKCASFKAFEDAKKWQLLEKLTFETFGAIDALEDTDYDSGDGEFGDTHDPIFLKHIENLKKLKSIFLLPTQ